LKCSFVCSYGTVFCSIAVPPDQRLAWVLKPGQNAYFPNVPIIPTAFAKDFALEQNTVERISEGLLCSFS
jgi:hypothetical protein